jgi:nucleoside-diphosphate-sugar epimerase
MDVVIAGGHGQVGLALGRLLADRGDRARGLIRKREHEEDLRTAGVEPVLCDLEGGYDVAAAIEGADAVVFAAGAGPGSGADRKWSVDYAGAAKLIVAALAGDVRRYVMVSAMGADSPPSDDDDVFSVYLRAKARADDELRASSLEWTIARPGLLTDDPGTGKIQAAKSVERGRIPREDVAATLLAVLDEPGTIGVAFEVVSGEVPIPEAVAAL